jgi:outer membrane protein OmpA-like peptidoglycan-associated protein
MVEGRRSHDYGAARKSTEAPMTITRIVLPAAILLALCAPAAAQMYPGQDVSVNPAATGGGQVLLYPGGKYMRVVPPLLQPGQAGPQQPIFLHMPVTHHRVARVKTPEAQVATAPEASAPIDAVPEAAPLPAPTTEITPPAPLPPAKHKIAKAAPPPVPAVSDNTADNSAPSSAIPFSFGGPTPGQSEQHGKPAIQKQQSAPSPQSAPPVKVASAEPTPVVTTTGHAEEPPNLSKRSEILFPHNATDPTPESAGSMKQLASTLNSALNAGALRVQLDAFGGAPGDKSTDARRVSLKRALVIRQLLIDAGVPASRIDVRAMGGIDDTGNADRVDVYVRAG